MSELHTLVSHEDQERQHEFVTRLRSGKSVLFRPRGTSMLPHVPDGTIVMVDPVVRPLKPGEVVLALLGDRVLLHRIVKVRVNQIWLWGDALAATDGPVPLDAIVGIARLPKLSWQQTWMLNLKRLWRRAVGQPTLKG